MSVSMEMSELVDQNGLKTRHTVGGLDDGKEGAEHTNSVIVDIYYFQ